MVHWFGNRDLLGVRGKMGFEQRMLGACTWSIAVCLCTLSRAIAEHRLQELPVGICRLYASRCLIPLDSGRYTAWCVPLSGSALTVA